MSKNNTMHFRFPDKPTEVTPEFVAEIQNDKWIAQDKYDGWRAVVFIDGKKHIRMLSRQGKPLNTTNSSERQKAIETLQLEIDSIGLPPGTVLDCELVGPRGSHPWHMYIFDCLAWEGIWLANIPFEQRWSKCTSINSTKHVSLAETIYGGKKKSEFLDEFNRLKEEWNSSGKGMHLCEGIVLKKRTGLLTLHPNSSKKSNCMFKLKYRDIRNDRF